MLLRISQGRLGEFVAFQWFKHPSQIDVFLNWELLTTWTENHPSWDSNPASLTRQISAIPMRHHAHGISPCFIPVFNKLNRFAWARREHMDCHLPKTLCSNRWFSIASICPTYELMHSNQRYLNKMSFGFDLNVCILSNGSTSAFYINLSCNISQINFDFI